MGARQAEEDRGSDRQHGSIQKSSGNLQRDYTGRVEAVKTRSSIPTEHHEQVAIFRWRDIAVKQEPRLAMLIAIPNAGGYVGGFKANLRRVMSMKAEGVAKGFPDMVLLCPSQNRTYPALFIELKRVKNYNIGADQFRWRDLLNYHGYAVEFCIGADHAIETIKIYLGMK
jgi:hypothetical protein